MKITCIIPVYNGERFLGEALESVLDQQYPDLEVIVVDDGSTDDTPEILARFRKRIRVLRQDHSGVAAARNLAMTVAEGDYIAFQDADDIWMPGKLAVQSECFRTRPELEICVGLIENFWMDEVAEEEEGYRGRKFAGILPGYSLVCLLARKDVFDRVGLFDPSLRVGSDNDWFLRARDVGVVEEVVPQLLVRRRLHTGNLTRSDLANRDQLIRNMKASLDRRRAHKES
jgi:glycosyltransferase involved in cell wall biosynthesis